MYMDSLIQCSCPIRWALIIPMQQMRKMKLRERSHIVRDIFTQCQTSV